ncbi:transcription factor KAN3 [Tripterygium wilfordii]|uniref:Transcription factor KAN3 n=1 Tax=Tripterygium wilfordii TaxID=458696 RepID=A0A7J7C042_TRIWF|nr:transcription factor HHO6-like [Tripterygium wilfordii]KAF5727237.1 transcription factor KAN3 [Tripterygium wilfordii]
MGSLPPELSLDFRPTFVPKTISDFLKEVSVIGNVSDKVSRLDEFVKGLEEEMKKIDAFKRELPLCMLLLNDAIFTLKEESIQCTATNLRPVLEEFIPLKKDSTDEQPDIAIKREKDSKDKKNWMSSVQLWNPDISDPKENPKSESKRSKGGSPFAKDDPFDGCKNRGAARSFMSFKTCNGMISKEDGKEELPIQGLSLLTPGIKSPREESGSLGTRVDCNRTITSSAPYLQKNSQNGPQTPQQQTSRKQRRCWSPELHRRFVSALQQLGGSHAATPKQIRELMQVDGLTNDEVKSHLQKFRLHSQRVSSTGSTGSANQSVVVLGGLWMPQQDQCGDSSKVSQSGSPEGPLQLAMNTRNSTEGDSMEDEEDEKYESYSWRSNAHKSGKVDVL